MAAVHTQTSTPMPAGLLLATHHTGLRRVDRAGHAASQQPEEDGQGQEQPAGDQVGVEGAQPQQEGLRGGSQESWVG